MLQKLVSVNFRSDFGFFRKPDINNGIHLSYNMMHKPALLGILGAIIGLDGYRQKGETPAYYKELQSVKTGIEPVNHEKGNYAKTVIKYSNTIGYANKGTNYLTEEATLIKPSYICYFLLDMEQENQAKLFEYLQKGEAEYIPYFGKNEFAAWWDKEDFKEYDFEEYRNEEPESKKISTLFLKNKQIIKDQKQDLVFDFSSDDVLHSFLYFERLPAGFDKVLNQYDLQEFAYSTFDMKATFFSNLYFLKSANKYVQLL